MDDTLVRVEKVSKKYCKSLKRSLWYGVKDIGSELVLRKSSYTKNTILRENEFWAVKDVSFELNRGDCLGLVGQNGAGKSTLLKMLNGLIKVDSGRIEMKGRVGAMIQLGAGFNPILTGRENIYINASVLGFSKSEIDEKFDEIVEFSEIGEFIDMPVQNYSSGMTVRLGFAIASQLEPDILLIDEVLAVGDMGFVIKCLNAINRLIKTSAVILVSHSMPHISRICNKIIVMEKGESIFNDSDVSNGVDLYFQRFKSPLTNFIGNDEAKLLDIRLDSSSTRKPNRKEDVFMINFLDDMVVELDLEIDKKYSFPSIGLVFFNLEMRNIAESHFYNDDNSIKNNDGKISVRAIIPKINLNRGLYTITVVIFKNENRGSKYLLRAQSVIEFQVTGVQVGWGDIRFKTSWTQVDN